MEPVASSQKPGLSFIIPAYNEEGGVSDTIKRLKDVLGKAGMAYEIIVVNDGSTDGTMRKAAEFSGVKIVNHPTNIGYGNAIKSGLKKAQYDWIGITDADGTYPIESLPELIAEMGKGFDMVIGSRSNMAEMDNGMKRLSRWVFKRIIKMTVKNDIYDPNSGFRLFRREIAIRFYPFLCGSFSFTTSLTLFASGEPFFVKYVPIQYSARCGKSKVRHGVDSLRTILYIVQGITFFNPIKFFLLLSASMVIFVCIPAMVIALFRMFTLSLYYMIFGTTVTFLIGLGVIGDIIRISASHKFRSLDVD